MRVRTPGLLGAARIRSPLPLVTGLLCVAAGLASASSAPRAASGTPASPVVVPAYRQANTVAVLEVTGIIDGVTLRSLERRVAEASRMGADAVVLRLDTPGGEMNATLDICHLIKSDAPANTVAWIDPKAYSAGTFIALACREIVMSSNGRMGDAAPISPLGPIPATERAKIESPLLSEAIDSARRAHYDEHLVRAFVTLSPSLWLLENVSSGERIVTEIEEFRRVMGHDPPTSAPPPPSLTAAAAPLPLLSKILPQRGRPSGPQTPAAAARQQLEFEQQLPPVRAPLTEADRGSWRLVHQVIPDGQLLTLTHDEARYYGFVSATIDDLDELREWFGATRIFVLSETWSERLVRFLLHPVVRGVLLVIFLVSLFIEMAAPGVGVFGAAAVAALLLFVGAPWLAGLAHLWEILLIAVGLVLIAAELFFIPGTGIAGIAGGICLFVGVVGTFVGALDGTPTARNELLRGLATTLGGIFVAGTAIWMIARRLPSVPFIGRFALTAELAPGGVGASAARTVDEGRAVEVGDLGLATTDLRPSGRGLIHGRVVEVSSVEGFLVKGTPLRVVAVGRFEIEVEAAQ
ncbi:MAG TPA: hypothetical protein PKC43_07630 [Phycisphaerales bacterium]|nr:hypothetical protein [Phycisphaerales bacterium]HMP37306.1 hypothetical protein [Phycisphaerales bacterium]